MGEAVELSVLIPVYNEAANLEPLVGRVRATLDDWGSTWELVLIDDGSTDGSAEVMDRLGAEDPRLVVLHFERNCGQSAALDAGIRHGRGRLLAYMDADLQTFPEDLPLLLGELEDESVDGVVGIRTERQDSGWKKLSSRLANWVRNRLTREDIVDTGCPLKVFRGEALRSLRLFDGLHRFIPTLVRMEGFNVRQVPVRHAPRHAGRSKYGTWDRAFRALRDAFAVRWMQDRIIRWRLR